MDHSKKSKRSNKWLYYGGGLVLIFIVLQALGYIYLWDWVGVVVYEYAPNGTPTAVKSIKTIWDWLDLLIVPLALGIGAWWLNESQRRAEFQLAANRLEEDQKIEEDRKQEERVQLYFDRMTDLILEQGQTKSSNISYTFKKDSLMRARTLTVLRNLSPERKRIVLQFLFEATLLHTSTEINYVPSIEEPESVPLGLEGADFSGANLREAEFFNYFIDALDIDNIHISGGITLNGANLQNADLTHANLTSANLRKTNLSKAVLTQVNLHSADMKEACLQNTNLYLANLNYADLSKSDLRNANFNEADLNNAILDYANLEDAKFEDARMQSASLEGAKMESAFLVRALLNSANMKGAHLSYANMRNTYLAGANLRGAFLFEAKLDGADLSNADLTDAQIEPDQIEKIGSLKNAVMPDGRAYEEWKNS